MSSRPLKFEDPNLGPTVGRGPNVALQTRDGAGSEFFRTNPTGKIQILRRLTGRSTVFLKKVFCSLFNASYKKFSKGRPRVNCYNL